MTSENDTSAGALFAKRDELENEAAQLLGRIMLAYSRLDMQLGLCVAWAAGGQRVQEVSRQIGKWDLNKRLERLSRVVYASTGLNPAGRAAYAEWIQAVHQVREERNQMVHGRWGVEAAKNCVVNVVGLPSSPDQLKRPYTLKELAAFLGTVERLGGELFSLRERYPLAGVASE